MITEVSEAPNDDGFYAVSYLGGDDHGTSSLVGRLIYSKACFT